LSQTEIRDGFRLVGEVCELGDDPLAWRGHLLAGLCRLAGASRGFCDEETVATDPARSGVLACAQVGLDAAAMKLFGAYVAEGSFHIHPLFPVIQPVAHRPWTHTRRELFPDDRLWYAHRVVNDYKRPADMDDCIHSRQPIPRPGWSNMCAVFRAWGERPFSVRNRRLVHLVHEEMGHRWRRPAPPDPADVLPQRLGQVARRLRAGDSEKQIALRLDLSRQTIHAYAKELHRRLGVSNRFDLLARLAPPRTAYRPRLGFEVKV
jgi:DNA-binding CsgD family transcriptional regulator